MRTFKGMLIAAGLVSVAAVPAFGQATVNGSSSITIGTVLYISATNTSVGFAAPTAANFDAGFINSTTTTSIAHRGNVRHSVTVAAGAATMTASGGRSGSDAARSTKPAADLQWSTDGSNFAGLSTTAAAVRSGAARGAYSDLNVQYRMALSYADDTPGTYAMNFTYTIAAD